MTPTPRETLWQHFRVRLHELLFSVDPLHLSGVSGSSAFCWGVWVAWPWSVSLGSPSYKLMVSWAPEVVWGLGGAALGAFQLWAILDRRAPYSAQLVANFVMLPMWSFLMLLTWLSYSSSTGVPVFGNLFVAALWSYVRRVREGRLP